MIKVTSIILTLLIIVEGFAMDTQKSDDKNKPTPASKRRITLVDELLSLLDDEEFMCCDHRSAALVMELLGELKARQAIPILIRDIDFRPKCDPINYTCYISEGYFKWLPNEMISSMKGKVYKRAPALVALVRIGEPSLGPALELLKSSKEYIRYDLVMNLVYGVKGEKGVELIKSMLAQEKELIVKKRLEDCITLTKKDAWILPEVSEARKVRLLEEDPSQSGSPLQQYRETWQRDPIKFNSEPSPQPAKQNEKVKELPVQTGGPAQSEAVGLDAKHKKP